MFDHLGVKVGSVWMSGEKPSLIVVSKVRTGHQYDRYYLCDCASEEGKIIQIEDFELVRLYREVTND